MKIFIGVWALLGFVGVSSVYAQDPFSRGNELKIPTLDERESIARWLRNAKKEATTLLSEISQGPLAEREIRVRKKIIEMVLRSSIHAFNTKGMFQIALTQGLAITQGLPGADGTGLRSPGPLGSGWGSEVRLGILEDSLRLALEFYQHDLILYESEQAPAQDWLRFAHRKAVLLRDWARVALPRRMRHKLVSHGLRQWLDVMQQPENLRGPVVSTEVESVIQALGDDEAGDKFALYRMVETLPERMESSARSVGMAITDDMALPPSPGSPQNSAPSPTPESPVLVLRELFASPESETRQEGCRRLAEVDSSLWTPDATRLLIEALGDHDPKVSAQAYLALTHQRKVLTEIHVADLVRALSSTHPLSRFNVVQVLGRIEGEAASRALATQASDTDPQVRAEALRLLRQRAR